MRRFSSRIIPSIPTALWPARPYQSYSGGHCPLSWHPPERWKSAGWGRMHRCHRHSEAGHPLSHSPKVRASVVPSPPSATGRTTTSASGSARSIPSRIASPASREDKDPLSESVATTIFMSNYPLQNFFSASFFLPFRPSGPGSLLPAGRDPHPSAVRPGAKPRYLPQDSGPFGTVTWLYPERFSARDFLTVIVSAWNSRYNKVGKSSKFKCCMAYCRSLPMHLFIQGKNPFGMVTLVCGVHASVHTREELQYRY